MVEQVLFWGLARRGVGGSGGPSTEHPRPPPATSQCTSDATLTHTHARALVFGLRSASVLGAEEG